jgi:uncharacterized protein YsxB (DUF464 family)
MIQIQTSQHNGYMKIEVHGHANYDEHGKDIVCAAVSAIMQTALLGLHSVAEAYPEYVRIQEDQQIQQEEPNKHPYFQSEICELVDQLEDFFKTSMVLAHELIEKESLQDSEERFLESLDQVTDKILEIQMKRGLAIKSM